MPDLKITIVNVLLVSCSTFEMKFARAQGYFRQFLIVNMSQSYFRYINFSPQEIFNSISSRSFFSRDKIANKISCKMQFNYVSTFSKHKLKEKSTFQRTSNVRISIILKVIHTRSGRNEGWTAPLYTKVSTRKNLFDTPFRRSGESTRFVSTRLERKMSRFFTNVTRETAAINQRGIPLLSILVSKGKGVAFQAPLGGVSLRKIHSSSPSTHTHPPPIATFPFLLDCFRVFETIRRFFFFFPLLFFSFLSSPSLPPSLEHRLRAF